jgi:hypothetical protein
METLNAERYETLACLLAAHPHDEAAFWDAVGKTLPGCSRGWVMHAAQALRGGDRREMPDASTDHPNP